MVCPEYSTDGNPSKLIDNEPILNDDVICINAPNINWALICGNVTYHNSCHLFLIPSTAAASYKSLSTVCKPATNDKKLIPKLNHN